jgi:hypothetical protein
MALPIGTYKLDYVDGEGIVITFPPGKRKVFPTISANGSIPAGSPITPYHDIQTSPYLKIEGTTFNNLTRTQQFMRVWDMMKDGTPSMNTTIMDIMLGNGIRAPAYQRFHDIKHALINLPSISAKITKSSWIKPNSYGVKYGKLDSRYTYQESGLSPEELILNPHYVINIGNTVIDPFTRNFHGPGAKTYFPGAHSSVEITRAFFNFMGFKACHLKDTQLKDGSHEDDHKYELTVAQQVKQGVLETLTIKKYNDPTPPHNRSNGWYAGNKAKNASFGSATTLQQQALLNAKELGDVSQVFLMFMSIYTIGQGMIHTMVTGDAPVFMLCIMLGIDCMYYHHLPRVAPNLHGEMFIYHFNANYRLKQAKKHFTTTRNIIVAHNEALIQCITRIKDLNVGIYMTSFELVKNFRFCNDFLVHIIEDMKAITEKLKELDPNTLIDDDGSGDNLDDEQDGDKEKISKLSKYTFQLKLYYKIKVLFTINTNGRGGVNFAGLYSKYTEKPTPSQLQEVGIAQPTVININDNDDDSDGTDGPQVANNNIFHPLALTQQNPKGWNLSGYDRTTPFYTLYMYNYVFNEKQCMHPTKEATKARGTIAAQAAMQWQYGQFLLEQGAQEAAMQAVAAAEAAAAEERRKEREAEKVAQQRNSPNIVHNRPFNNDDGDVDGDVDVDDDDDNNDDKPATKRKRTGTGKGGGISPKRSTSRKKSPSKHSTSPKKSPSSRKTSPKKVPSYWGVLELDTDRKVMYTPPDSDSPPIDIHRQWFLNMSSFVTNFCNETRGAKDILDKYREEFYRDIYEHCDNYNVVLRGAGLDKLIRETITRIMSLHHTYIVPITTNKVSIQKPITYTPFTAEQLTMFRKYLAQQQQINARLSQFKQTSARLPQHQRLAITAGGRHTRKRFRNKARRTRKLLRGRR